VKSFLSVFFVVNLLWMSSLYANVSITTQSYQRAAKKKNVKWVKATKVIPGSVVLYVNTLKNSGKETATRLEVVNEIPEHMYFLNNSAECKGQCYVTYSVNHGKTFARPEKLFVKDKKTRKSRVAKASEYTTIKWVVVDLKGGKTTMVRYKSRLK